MLQKSLCATFALLSLANPAMAAEEKPAAPLPSYMDANFWDREHQGVGLYVSNLAGAGLTYRHRWPSGWGFHVSGFAYAAPGQETLASAGAAVTKEFTRIESVTLYGLLATGFGYSSQGSLWGGGFAPNVAPGVGIGFGGFYGELGYSLYRNDAGTGFIPGWGIGWSWDF